MENLNKDDNTLISEKIGGLSLCDKTSHENPTNKAPSLIVIGMAGSGKTTFIQKLVSELSRRRTQPYVVNLDPAVLSVPYPVNIDIRTSVKFKQIMKQYKLGPNGAIVTCLNLFATKFDQVYNILQERIYEHKHILFDTPGQIEVFTWSASGSIICESLATISPTILIYLMDAEKSQNPTTFMSNMLHACSIMYRTRLPIVLVLNKIDCADDKKIIGWIKDFESFDNEIENYDSYMSNLVRSMSMVLEEFYSSFNCVGVSSITGEGFDDFLDNTIPAAVDEFEKKFERYFNSKKL